MSRYFICFFIFFNFSYIFIFTTTSYYLTIQIVFILVFIIFCFLFTPRVLLLSFETISKSLHIFIIFLNIFAVPRNEIVWTISGLRISHLSNFDSTLSKCIIATTLTFNVSIIFDFQVKVLMYFVFLSSALYSSPTKLQFLTITRSKLFMPHDWLCWSCFCDCF